MDRYKRAIKIPPGIVERPIRSPMSEKLLKEMKESVRPKVKPEKKKKH